jgi:hypothetical protein
VGADEGLTIGGAGHTGVPGDVVAKIRAGGIGVEISTGHFSLRGQTGYSKYQNQYQDHQGKHWPGKYSIGCRKMKRFHHGSPLLNLIRK